VGAIITAGGLGVALNANVGGALGVKGNTAITGTLGVGGNADITGTVDITGAITHTATTASSTSTTGAIITEGGLGVKLNANVGGTLGVGGVVTATSYVESSDRNYKRSIESITNALEKIQQIRGVNYFFRTADFPDEGFPSDLQSGFIAQEVEGVISEAVSTDGETGMKRMNYKSITPYLVQAVKEQQETIEKQGVMMEKQQRQIEELQAQMKQLVQSKQGSLRARSI
jgi:hypothetical protein